MEGSRTLQPPEPASRPLSIRTNATSATQMDITGETWKTAVTKENCWDDLILTLGTSMWGRVHGTARDSQPGVYRAIDEGDARTSKTLSQVYSGEAEAEKGVCARLASSCIMHAVVIRLSTSRHFRVMVYARRRVAIVERE
jgi:hypothetical protein